MISSEDVELLMKVEQFDNWCQRLVSMLPLVARVTLWRVLADAMCSPDPELKRELCGYRLRRTSTGYYSMRRYVQGRAIEVYVGKEVTDAAIARALERGQEKERELLNASSNV